jgi:hypothetical protein
MADIMGLFDSAPAAQPSVQGAPAGGMADLMGGFAGMDLSGTSAPPPPGQQLGHGPPKGVEPKGGSEDLLGLF